MNDQERHKFYKQACSMRKKGKGKRRRRKSRSRGRCGKRRRRSRRRKKKTCPIRKPLEVLKLSRSFSVVNSQSKSVGPKVPVFLVARFCALCVRNEIKKFLTDFGQVFKIGKYEVMSTTVRAHLELTVMD
ncbi:hypothetical protein HUJ05_010467 [Dendroctonus ponderosae]|nr:hypothetical protein HUJ05_005798 [Dendroctonus ponderosae]KAH1025809.1 hypothetical protein HUJ05_010463 [Dendroctonus ponderosae]KAH1025816.1 hypothetical protein HUJ05_010467 [Dendroctonus ponderosae]